MKVSEPLLRATLLRLVVPIALVALQAALTVMRVSDVRQGYGTRNLEASYHAILTAKALLRTPFTEHWGLPTVTLGAPNDKGISWGAAVVTEHGDYIYTSFPPVGFWLPALAAAARGGDIGLGTLVVINGLLAAVSGLLLHVIVLRSVRRMERSVWAARCAGAGAATLYVVSAESLQSHGAVYWPHALLQPLLLAQLLVLDQLLSGESAWSRRALLWTLAVLTVVACYTEWSAYVFAFAVGAVILLVPTLRRRAMSSGMVLMGAALVTLAALAAHFILVLGVDGAVEGWRTRLVARVAGEGPPGTLHDGYLLSYGGTLLAVLAIMLIAAFRLRPVGRRPDAASIALVTFALAAVTENVVLIQHATQYTFDRLKLGIALALIAGLVIGMMTRRAAVLAGAFVCLAAAMGITLDDRETENYASWPEVDHANRAMIEEVRSRIDLTCATIGMDISVRAYANVVLDRGAHEYSTVPSLGDIAQEKGSCGVVLIEAEIVQADLPRFLTATVIPMNGGR